MAKVSLRIYNREIERLVEQGHTDEAIAHCRHILKVFPKHLETYRLLGKAYLEARRYAEAVDIFGRLLMAVPDDFVAHVGLSIIRDEENKLDDSIWHMERAFETQSSNPAIQSELQRLYGRRDGMEPPKVRMSRGALARIYVHGELYPQAVSEIRAVLAQDPQRVDMQLLLAFALYKGGQRADAADICNQLLKRYAYTFDANRIMVDLITGSAATETTQVYRLHVAEMDPYANFAKGSIFDTADIPDASINLERLEYTGEEVQMGQDWKDASLGFASVPPLGGGMAFADEQPDWLRSQGVEDAPQDSATADSTPQSGEAIPDFLREAGWGASTGPETPTSVFDDEPDGEPLAQADIPDWLKSQTPPAETPAAVLSPAIETPDYLSNLDPSFDPFAGASVPGNDAPDWLKDLGGVAGEPMPAQPVSAEPAQPASDVPDWLQGLGEPANESAAQPAEASGDVPDWLKSLDEPSQPVAAPVEETSNWLKGLGTAAAFPAEEPIAESAGQPAVSADSLGASAQEQDDAVAWLESLAAKHGAKPEELVTDPNKRSETPPEWVAQAQNVGAQSAAQTPPPGAESLGASAQEQDDAVAWLESLAAKHGAKPEELVTDPNKRSETPPEWVAQAQNIGSQPAAQTPPPSAESLGASAQEQDDAVAWLESLAAKHGAKPEELVTDPNKRSETPPEWVAQAQGLGSQPPAESEPAKSEWSENAQSVGEDFFAEFEKGSPVPPAADLPDWMKAEEEQPPLEKGSIPEWLSEAEPAKEEPPPSLDTSSLPDWLGGLDAGETAGLTPEESLVKSHDLSEWLKGLDDEPGLNIDPETLRAPQPPLQAPVAETPAASAELPDWMNAGKEEEPEEEAWTPPAAPVATPVTLSEELPDWLQSEGDAPVAEDSSGEDLPPWSHREQWEAEGSRLAPPKPTSPSDWHPISAPQPAQADIQPRAGQRLAINPPAPEPSAPKEKKKPARQALPRGRKSEGQAAVNLLSLARSELDRGDIPEALLHYGKLIKKGKHLEEVIGSLSESLYRYPVEVGIWQALGDAYMRANRLKEALDAYNKAEELIR